MFVVINTMIATFLALNKGVIYRIFVFILSLCILNSAASSLTLHSSDGDKGINTHVKYNLNNVTSKTLLVPSKCTFEIEISGFPNDTYFLVAQAHSQGHSLVLSYDRKPNFTNSVQDSDTGLVIFLTHQNDTKSATNYSDEVGPHFFLHNYHKKNVSVLLIIRNYTENDPIPGGLANNSFPLPYLSLDQNLLTTSVHFAPALLKSNNSNTLEYKVFLTYMYEGDLKEEHYWESVILSSTPNSLHKVAKIVDRFATNESVSDSYKRLFVSYTGVGTVVTVLVSHNGSNGSLYSTSVFYGCDFIPEEGYNCTKLVSGLAKFFCASLLFFGLVLLFFGHRWLNFTMFTSGFFFTWFVLFIVFIHIPNANFSALSICTFFGASTGGIGWLVMWHKIHRPFFSAILIIIQSGLLVAMIFVHFTKYAIVPSPSNIALYIIVPIALFCVIIAYAVFDIKRIHILSCSLLGSYMVVVPFAFYVGSSMTYIIINVVSVIAIEGFSQALGFPPFQSSDIIFLCIWIFLFGLGVAYQLYQEKSSPPFQPPSTASWETTKAFFAFFQEKLCLCRNQTSDEDSLFEEERSLFSRLLSSCPVLTSCKRGQEPLEGYESFPRIGHIEEGPSLFDRTSHSIRTLGSRIRNRWIELWGLSPEEHRRGSRESISRSILTEEVPEASFRPGENSEIKESMHGNGNV